MNLERLVETFEQAKKDKVGVTVFLTVPTQTGIEQITNPYENLDYKLEYYLLNYIEKNGELVLKHCHDIKIIDCKSRHILSTQ